MTESERPQLVLIDGHALAYRQFYAIKGGFTNSAGESTQAVFGFTRVLRDLFERVQPDYLAVVFDRGLSGREQLYPDYKATRADAPEGFDAQVQRIEQIIDAFNVPLLVLDGYEADDIIGTVAQQAEAQGIHTHIITGDRDLLQLLTPHVTVQLPRRDSEDVTYTPATFSEEYGFAPPALVDFKALMGDSSDNIPGVAGVGKKTAADLLHAFGSLDGIYANLDATKGAVRRKLEAGRDMAYLSYELATIKRDVPVVWSLAKCHTQDYDPAEPLRLFQELEFRGYAEWMAGKLQGAAPAAAPSESADSAAALPADLDGTAEAFAAPRRAADFIETVTVQDEAALAALVGTLKAARAIAFDTETTGIDQMAADLVGISLAVDGERGFYIPVGHTGAGAGTMFAQAAEPQLPLERVIEALRGPLTDPAIPKIAHNATYDLVMLRRYGIDVQPIGFDTMIAEWLRNPISRNTGLKNFAASELNISMTEITDLIGTGKKQRSISSVPVAEVAPYAAADAAVTYRAASFLRARLEADHLLDLYETLETPLIPVIATMEQAGVMLDVAYLAEMSQRLDERLSAIEQEIFDLSGGYGAFNINSPKQLNDLLFGKLDLPVQGIRKTTHGYSTDAGTLDKLWEDTGHPVLKRILDYRELTKLKGTYVDALPALVNRRTGRLHTSYNQTGTTTGRLSSSDPNLQNIPIRTDIGREVRRAFIASPGRVLLAVDYSQIELRVMAHISQDETLIEAFAQDQDIHAATAAAVYGISLDAVTYDQRSFAKRVNFGLMYGMGAFRLARDSDLTLAEAEAFINTYFQRLPRVREYIENTRRLAAEQGYLTTLVGRKRRFPALNNPASSRQAKEAEYRAAINMPIQGTAADIMKKAMIEVHAALQRQHPTALMTLQVHDELVFDVPEEAIDQVAGLVVRIMETTYPLAVPLKANAEIGPNWRDMTAITASQG